jgi:hypothetical protein
MVVIIYDDGNNRMLKRLNEISRKAEKQIKDLIKKNFVYKYREDEMNPKNESDIFNNKFIYLLSILGRFWKCGNKEKQRSLIKKNVGPLQWKDVMKKLRSVNKTR